jgi:hypothetical protein
VANDGKNTISVLLGDGDGIFRTQVQYAAGVEPLCVALGDFSGDGKLDLATADVVTGSVAVLMGNGDGTFQPFASYPANYGSAWTATGDFNGDGNLDLAVTGSDSNVVSILIGNGDGTFQSPVSYTVGSDPVGSSSETSTTMGKLILPWSTMELVRSRCCWATAMALFNRNWFSQ